RLRKLIVDGDRRMVREQHASVDGRALGALSSRGRGNLIVQPPAEIPWSRSLEVIPPGIVAGLGTDQRPIGVDKALCQQIVHPPAGIRWSFRSPKGERDRSPGERC